MKKVIFNADMGEGTGMDEEIMPLISWCNIACGGHAGNEKEINKTIQLAKKNGVKIGAHPSYPDRLNFGRKVIPISYTDLVDALTEQLLLIDTCAKQHEVELHHVKPHGALYNEAVVNDEVAHAILESIQNLNSKPIILTLKNAQLATVCKDTYDVCFEAFADRNYTNDLSLVPRAKKGALLENEEEVFEHVLRMVSECKVKTIKEQVKPISFDTICVHGDNPRAVEILKYLHMRLKEVNFDII